MAFDRTGMRERLRRPRRHSSRLPRVEGQAGYRQARQMLPPSPIETKWGVGFRDYSECLEAYSVDAASKPLKVPSWRFR